MNEGELEQCYIALGVAPSVTLEELERTFMKRNFALIKGKAGAADEANPELDAQRRKLRAAYDRLAEHLREQQRQAEAANPRRKPHLAPAHAPLPPAPPKGLLTPPVLAPRDPADDEFILFRFDNWKVNTFVPPLLLGIVWVVNLTPLKFLLTGFHVWMHEFGHATAAWLCGFRATPLPFGWTPVEPVYSPFVYFGLLLMFGILFVAGWLERKVWAMAAAVALAGLQFYMTWRMP
ncbi:MAG: M50 family metallopeptidase, partial [Opitutus sp.]